MDDNDYTYLGDMLMSAYMISIINTTMTISHLMSGWHVCISLCLVVFFPLSFLISLFHGQASFVLCRVFARPCCRNSASEIGPSSWAEESVSAVHHIGIQHDGFVTPDVVEAKVCDDRSVNRKEETSVYPLRCIDKPDDHQVLTAPVSAATFQRSVSLQGSQQVNIF